MKADIGGGQPRVDFKHQETFLMLYQINADVTPKAWKGGRDALNESGASPIGVRPGIHHKTLKPESLIQLIDLLKVTAYQDSLTRRKNGREAQKASRHKRLPYFFLTQTSI